jgi:hypothetical protein
VKEKFCNADMKGSRKSDNNIVPEKPANKEGKISAEQVEGRALTKGNTVVPAAVRTQGRGVASNGLQGVRRKAQQDKDARFNNLLHHITPELLTMSFYSLKKNAAAGVDKVSWYQYNDGLAERIEDLHNRVHAGSYRAQPVRRSYINKTDGRKRPLGVTALEDKIVQQAAATILNQIYETDFMGFSYGFREKRSQHDALDALHVGISRCKISFILDADISAFFDQIDHEWLKNGKFFIRRKTIKKRFVKKYKEVKQELKERMHDDVIETGKWLNSVIRGFQNYYAVPGNMNAVKSFYDQTTSAWLHTLRRRSQKGRNFTWERFEKLIRWLIPRVRMIHPFPSQRFQRYYPR